ncbi:hypothetical protein CPT_Slocum_029 [Serratia phage Slocum]|nr:hypothetical protein CPT_Slocum_029 [Serratia phage Slocum]
MDFYRREARKRRRLSREEAPNFSKLLRILHHLSRGPLNRGGLYLK